MMFYLLLVFVIGFALGFILACGYYATLTRQAFGLGEEVKIHGWLKTKADKRKLDQGRKGSA